MDSPTNIWLIGASERDFAHLNEVLSEQSNLTIHYVHDVAIADDKAISKILSEIHALILIAFEYTCLRKLGSRIIIQLRKSRIDARIICLCKEWPDAESLFWLNSVLRVSLVVIEPIMTNLFIHEFDKICSNSKELLSIKTGEDRADFTDSNLVPENEIVRSEIERRISETIVGLRKEALEEWKILSNDLLNLKEQKEDDTLRKNCLTRAHKLKGTFGSLGLKEIGERASEIEYCLTTQIPSDQCDEALWWHFLTETLNSGNLKQNVVEEPPTDSISCNDDSAIYNTPVVLIGRKVDCKHLAGNLRRLGFDVFMACDVREVINITDDFDCCTIVILSALHALPRFEICRLLNRQRHNKQWQIIYIENGIDESLRKDILSCGAEPLLDEIGPEKKLMSVIEEHCTGMTHGINDNHI